MPTGPQRWKARRPATPSGYVEPDPAVQLVRRFRPRSSLRRGVGDLPDLFRERGRGAIRQERYVMAVNDSRSMNEDFHQGSIDSTYIQLMPDRANAEVPPIERLDVADLRPGRTARGVAVLRIAHSQEHAPA